MKRVKISVLKTTFDEELFAKYGGKPLAPCSYNTVGMEFFTNGWQKPLGLCDNAWKSMQEYAFALAHGGGNIFNNWVGAENMTIVSCNDGFRPVIYKLERVDENADEFMDGL